MAAGKSFAQNRVQRAALFAGGLFVAVLVVSVAARSSGRRGHTAPAAVEEESKLHLEDFTRVNIEGGRETWQVKARDAKYYSKEDVTHVSDAEVTGPRDKGGRAEKGEKLDPVKIYANKARLSMDGDAMRRADLEGDVRVVLDRATTMRTEAATYDSESRLITAPGLVHIIGDGYTTDGTGMEMAVDTNIMKLLSDVESAFTGTSMPSALKSGSLGGRP